MVTRRPRDFSRLPSEEAVSPLPSEEATPPVTKRCLVGCEAAKLTPVVGPDTGGCGEAVGSPTIHGVLAYQAPERPGWSSPSTPRRTSRDLDKLDQPAASGGRARRDQVGSSDDLDKLDHPGAPGGRARRDQVGSSDDLDKLDQPGASLTQSRPGLPASHRRRR